MRPSLAQLYRKVQRERLPEIRSDEFEPRVPYRPSYADPEGEDPDAGVHASVEYWCRTVWPSQTEHCPVQIGVVDYLLNADADRGLTRRDLLPLVPYLREVLPRPGPRTRSPEDEIEVISDVVRTVLRAACHIQIPTGRPRRPGPMPRRMQGAPTRCTEGWAGNRVGPIDALDALPRGDNSSRLWRVTP
jgi:hypothetical protein